MSAMPALALAGVPGGTTPAAAAAGTSISSWLKVGLSAAALAPITLDRMPYGQMRPTKPSPLDDAADSKPYALAQPIPVYGRGTAPRASVALNLWRRQIGLIQKILRRVSQAAYLLSVPFVMLLILGAVIKNRPLALMGATAVVILNIGRIVAGLANLAVVPLRDGINVNKLRKPAWRVAEPALTIVAVILVFTFVPWLSRVDTSRGNFVDRLREGSRDLKDDIKGELNKHVDVNRLESQAREQLDKLGEQVKQIDVNKLGAEAQSKLKNLAPSSGDGPGKSLPAAGKDQ